MCWKITIRTVKVASCVMPLCTRLNMALLLQRLAWRTDSCLDCQGPAGEDLSGGYYEAGGSYLKFSFPTAYTFTQLAWGVVEFRDGYNKVAQNLALIGL